MQRRILPALAALPVLVYAQKISVEFDQSRDFSDFRTFAIGGTIYSKNPLLNNEIVQKDIETEIRRRMGARGFAEVPLQPDINTRYSLGSNHVSQREAYPGGWRGLGTRVVTTHFTGATLVIDLRDPKRHALVWCGIAVEDKSHPLQNQGSYCRKHA